MEYLRQCQTRVPGQYILESCLHSEMPEAWLFGIDTAVQSVEGGVADSAARLKMRHVLLAYISNRITSFATLPSYLSSKIATALAAIVKLDFPDYWPTAFCDLSSILSSEVEKEILLRFFAYLNDTIAHSELSNGWTPEERERGQSVKDAMKEEAIPTFLSLISTTITASPRLTETALFALKGFIEWIDISLVMEPNMLSLLFSICHARDADAAIASTGCLQEVITKKMHHNKKIAILSTLSLPSKLPFSEDARTQSLASIFCYGLIELVQSFEKALSCEAEKEYADSCFSMMEAYAARCMQYIGDDRMDVMAFGVEAIAYFVSKTKMMMGDERQDIVWTRVQAITTTCLARMVAPEGFTFDDEEEDEERFSSIRKELMAVLGNIGRLIPDYTKEQMLSLMKEFLQEGSSMLQLEAALYVCYHAGEIFRSEVEDLSGGFFHDCMVLIFKQAATYTASPTISMYFECVARYGTFFAYDLSSLPVLLGQFFSPYGMYHSEKKVRERVTYLFTRITKVKPICEGLTHYLRDITSHLMPVIDGDKKGDRLASKLSDQTKQSLFDAFSTIAVASLLRTHESGLSVDNVTGLVVSIIRTIASALEAPADTCEPWMLSGLLSSLCGVSRPFDRLVSSGNWRDIEDARSTIASSFYSTYPVVLSILSTYASSLNGDVDREAVQSKAFAYLHRLVDILEDQALPPLITAFPQLLQKVDVRGFLSCLVFFNQIVSKFKVNSAAFVKSIFFIVANRICNDVERLISNNSESPSSEVEREIREVRRTFGLFLYASAANEVLILLIQENHDVDTSLPPLFDCCLGRVGQVESGLQKTYCALITTLLSRPAVLQNTETGKWVQVKVFPFLYAVLSSRQFDELNAETLQVASEVGRAFYQIWRGCGALGQADVIGFLATLPIWSSELETTFTQIMDMGEPRRMRDTMRDLGRALQQSLK
uniref:Exportin-T n=1 Tax=Palpitomonas bilix TaxID=652834 RepID=A0A7S3GFN6_9EUKA